MPTGTVTLLRLFDRAWGLWQRELAGCRLAPTRPVVHRLRVQSRRLLAVLAVIGVVLPRRRGAHASLTTSVEQTLRQLSALRDAQVQRSRVEREAWPGPAPEALVRYLRQREHRHARRAGRALERLDLARARRAALRLRAAIPRTRGHAVAPGAATAIARLAEQAFDKVMTRLSDLDPDRPKTLHRLRVSLKQLRYTFEVLDALTSQVGTRPLQAIGALQTALGRIQDADILIARIDRFGARHAGRAAALDGMRRALLREQRTLTARIVDAAPAIARLWPPAPSHPRRLDRAAKAD